MVRSSTFLVCHQVVQPDGINNATDIPDKMRRIKYGDPAREKILIFLTNNFTLPAVKVADIFRSG